MKTRTIIALVILTFTWTGVDAYHTDSSANSSATEIISLEKIPIIQCLLNGKTAFFVLDSGSDVSMVHSLAATEYLFSMEKRPSKSIIGVSGNQPLREAHHINLDIGRQRMATTFYSIDLTTVVNSLTVSTGIRISGIIGIDLMRKYGFEIDYGNETLVLHRVL